MSHSPSQPPDFEHGNGNGNGHANGQRYDLNRITHTPEPPQAEQSEGVDPRKIWSTIGDSRWLIAAITTAVTVATVVLCMFLRMTFAIDGSLYLGDTQSQKTGGLQILDILGTLGESQVQTELHIIRSQTLVTKAILESGLNVEIKDESLGTVRVWRWLLSGRDFQLLQPRITIRSAEVTDPALAEKNLHLKFHKDGNFELTVKERILGAGKVGELFAVKGLRLIVDATDLSTLEGHTFRIRVSPVDWIIDDVRNTLKVAIPKVDRMSSDVAVVELTFEDTSPFRGAAFLTSLMQSYLAQHLDWKTEEADATVKFADAQLTKIRSDLEAAEQRLATYKTDNGVVVLTDEARAIVEAQSNLETTRTEQQIYGRSMDELAKALRKPGAPVEAYLVGHSDDSVLTQLSNNLATAQQELKRLEEQFTKDAPVMREQVAVVSRQRDLIFNYITEKRKRSTEQVQALDRQIKTWNDKLRTLPKAELQLAAFMRETHVLSNVYNFLLEKQSQAELTKASTISKSRFLDKATIPWKEKSPNMRVALAGGILGGLLVSFLVVFVISMFAFTFQSDDEIRRVFKEFPLFGTVPHRQAKKASGTLAPAQSIFEENLRSGFAEAYRLLRTNLYYSAGSRKEKVVLVSSPGPGDGKTLTTLSLAHTLALDGKRVLLVDADLRKPSHHILLRLRQHPGLSSILTAEMPWQKVTNTILEVGRGRIDAITTGIAPPNPAELLSSNDVTRFIEEAREQYDFILIDTPPFPLVSDAMIMAMQGGRLLSVLRVKKTRRGPAVEHVRRLSAVCSQYGIVINDVSLFSEYGYGYGYGSGYGYAYGKASVADRAERS
jgi:tyrosine-protein kinase Etk/Wzc